MNALVSFDDGSGPRLYAGGEFRGAGSYAVSRVARWTGSDWEPVGVGLSDIVRELAVHDFGSGPRLCAATTDRVWSFDGSLWNSVGGAFNNVINVLTTYQGALCVGGSFTSVGGTAASRLARWSGSAWTDVAGGLDQTVECAAVFDDGSGEKLWVGGFFSTAGGVPAQRVAAFDGTSWVSVPSFGPGPIFSLAPHDSGAGARLFASTTLPSTSGLQYHVIELDAGLWVSRGRFDGRVSVLRSHDDGSGPVLLAGGVFGAVFSPSGVPQSSAGLARLRAGQWEAVPGFTASSGGVEVAAFEQHSVSGGALLVAGGAFSRAGGVVAGNVGLWNGVQWSSTVSVGGVTAPVNDLARFDDGSGVATYAIGLGGLARFDGTGWSIVPGVPAGGNAIAAGPIGTGGARLVVGTSAMGIMSWDGTSWTNLASVPGGLVGPGAPSTLAIFDEGGVGVLYVGGWFSVAGGTTSYRVARFDGTAWTDLGWFGNFPWAFARHDDGGGETLYVGGAFTVAGGLPVARVVRWNGTSFESVGTPGLGGTVSTLRTHDDGGGRRLYAGGQFSGTYGTNLSRWDGVAWSAVGASFDGPVADLAVFDDGTDSALVACGIFVWSGSTMVQGVASWNGTAWRPLGAGLSTTPFGAGGLGHSLLATTDRANGRAELFVGGSFDLIGSRASSNVAVWRGCSFDVFCAGDGVDPLVVACPCANIGGPGRGCANSLFANGAELVASGLPVVAQDTLTLTTNGVTGTFALFFQGDAFEGNGTGALLGDGVRCVGGSLRRLGTRAASGGVATHGFASGSSIASIGLVPAIGGPLHYQAWYRNAASFCTSDTFNLTNGVRVLWVP